MPDIKDVSVFYSIENGSWTPIIAGVNYIIHDNEDQITYTNSFLFKNNNLVESNKFNTKMYNHVIYIFRKLNNNNNNELYTYYKNVTITVDNNKLNLDFEFADNFKSVKEISGTVRYSTVPPIRFDGKT